MCRCKKENRQADAELKISPSQILLTQDCVTFLAAVAADTYQDPYQQAFGMFEALTLLIGDVADLDKKD